MKTFNPTLAIPYIASNTNFIPSPWSQDPSATDNTTVVADASITPDGANINLKVQDGWRWIQLGNPTHVYGYARTEINLTNQIGFTVFPAGVVTTFEWQGYFTSALPAIVSGEPFVAPFQIHHLGGGSPPYALEVDTSNHLLYLYIHNIDGTFNRRELLGDFNDLVNVSTNIKANYKPNSATGIADGSMQILINNVEVFSESGVENCVVQNKDYAKVGIYDFTNAIVDPSNPGRGQSLEMVVENFSVYLAATPTRTHIDTSQAGVPVGGTTNQVLKKNSSTDFDYSWGTGSAALTLQNVTDNGGSTTNSITVDGLYVTNSAFSGIAIDDGNATGNYGVINYNTVFNLIANPAGDGNQFFLSPNDGTIQLSNNTGGGFTSIQFNTTNFINLDLPNTSGQISSVTSGSGAPSSTPGYVGQFYVDTSGAKLYFSKGTSSSADWVVAN